MNTLEYASIIQKNLDKTMLQGCVTAWTEQNADKVIYKGGKEIKIPKMSVDGLGDYDRNGTVGYNGGAINLEYETRTMRYDRGRSFQFDENDVDETNYVVTTGSVMNEFQRTKVIPEVDALRIATMSDIAIKNQCGVGGFTPSKANVISQLKEGIKTIRENGFTGQLICHCTFDFKMLVELAMLGQLSTTSLKLGDITLEVPAIDGVALIETSSDKMISAITLMDGKTSGQTQGGYVKGADSLDVQFLLVAMEVPIAVSKTDKVRIFTPEENQNANAWKTDYRKYHDIWVLDNKVKGLYVATKQPFPSSK